MNLIVVLSTIVVLTACLVMHYEVLFACNRYLPLLSHRRRPRVLVLMFAILIAHVAEIWLFAAGYAVLVGTWGLGTLGGLVDPVLVDYVYFSAMTYTTVGFGDVVPIGPIRFLAGVEALTGLVMITWSASYTFLEMQRDWRPASKSA
jgi:Ion channel